MISPVAVVGNKLSHLLMLLPPSIEGATTGSSSKWLFLLSLRNRTPHVSKHPSRGGAEGKRTRYVVRLGGSSRITRATGRITKSRGAALAGIVMPVRAVRTFPSYSFNGVGGSLGENPICRY